LKAALEQLMSFKGSVSYGHARASTRRTLAVDDSGFVTDATLDQLGGPAEIVRVDRRPDTALIAELVARVNDAGAERIVAVGSGALIDGIKLVLQRSEAKAGREIDAVFVPCGAESYRAVARFAVVDDEQGQRPTVLDDRFARAEVCVAPALLGRLPENVVAINALDSAVHAIESLLSVLVNPFSRALATGALRLIFREAPLERASVVTASFLAAEAFASTRLGIAHAIASPLGTDLGITHDTINSVLGPRVIEFWGPAAPGFRDIAEASGVEAGTNEVVAALDRLRVAAGLPESLDELGIAWDRVEAVLPRAARSSGIAALASPLPEGGLEAFAHRAWTGHIDEEVANAGPA
jgi:alcohol dehydrogenase class IV